MEWMKEFYFFKWKPNLTEKQQHLRLNLMTKQSLNYLKCYCEDSPEDTSQWPVATILECRNKMKFSYFFF